MMPVTRTGSGAKDMVAIMERVREMSDSQLADILAGKDVSIPQYAAMTEAMGRKQLRQAVDGAQAQQQAQQPSIKDQLLAEQNAPQMASGIDQLPAPNMEAMGQGMAGGGIIAFENGGNVPGFYEGELIDGFGSNPNAAFMDQTRLEDLKRKKDIQQYEFLKDVSPVAAARMLEKDSSLEAKAPVAFKNPTPDLGENKIDVKPDAKTVTLDASAGLPAIDLGQATKFERRANPFGQMSAEKVDLEGLKDRGLGEGLMRLSAGLLSAPGAKGLSAGIAGLAEQAGLTRKETNALKKDARDYDFNLKRAESAFEQGNDELGLKYTEAANLNKYRMGSLNQEPGELRTLKAIMADPKLAAIYKGGKGAGVVSRTDALKEWNDLPASDKRKLQGMGVTDFSGYYNYLSTGLPGLSVVDTLDKGAKVRS